MSDTSVQPRGRLAALGAYGFEVQEPLILAALATGDPILLIGRSGTGKTFLLNSISEALGLEHRHYNASLISFDDLVGFPYPDDAKASVRFLETPATVWGAESVLIDEISRCKPEHQNRLFSLVHERKIQGLPLTRLRYRWAAMNPCSGDQSGGEEYLGAEPLDPALADRFAVILEVGDWDALSDADRRLVANPFGEGTTSDDGGELSAAVVAWQRSFAAKLDHCPASIVDYVCAATTALRDGGIRLSPRRARLITRTLLAATIVNGVAEDALGTPAGEALFRTVLDASLPQRAWGSAPDGDKVAAAHRLAWDSTMLQGRDRWLHQFHLHRPLERKAQLLLEECPDPDTGTLAVEQLLANEPKERAAAFALAAYPAAVAGQLPIGAEAVNDLGRLAQPMLTVDGEITWRERASDHDTTHPELAIYATVLQRLGAARRERAATALLLPGQQPDRRQTSRARAGVSPLRPGVRQGEDGMIADVCSRAPGYVPVAWDGDLCEREANSGAPMSRGRSERISASVLGNDQGAVRCPRVLRVGLDFGRRSPLACVRDLLETCGFSDEQEARLALALPQARYVCRPNPAPIPAPIKSLVARDALYQALVLGLCTAWCYDPQRPVLWTRASLTRQLELFDGGGFYA